MQIFKHSNFKTNLLDVRGTNHPDYMNYCCAILNSSNISRVVIVLAVEGKVVRKIKAPIGIRTQKPLHTRS